VAFNINQQVEFGTATVNLTTSLSAYWKLEDADIKYPNDSVSQSVTNILLLNVATVVVVVVGPTVVVVVVGAIVVVVVGANVVVVVV
jgi:hypothetical protein